MLGWFVGVTINVADPNPYRNINFQCSATFTAQSDSNGNYSTTSIISGAALIGVLVVLVATRKRRVATIDLAREEQRAGESTSGFEMMSDAGVRV